MLFTALGLQVVLIIRPSLEPNFPSNTLSLWASLSLSVQCFFYRTFPTLYCYNPFTGLFPQLHCKLSKDMGHPSFIPISKDFNPVFGVQPGPCEMFTERIHALATLNAITSQISCFFFFFPVFFVFLCVWMLKKSTKKILIDLVGNSWSSNLLVSSSSESSS